MKKIIISAVFVFILEMLLTSCQINNETLNPINTSDTVYNFDTDWQYYFRSSLSPMLVVSSEKGYYISRHSTGLIEYLDRESRKIMPLCAKANCDHTDREMCDAYLTDNLLLDPAGSSFNQAVQYYNQKLYFITYSENAMTMDMKYTLSSSEPNGTNIREIAEITTLDWIIHRGYVYCFSDHDITRFPLEKPDSIETIFKIDNYLNGYSTFSEKFFYGDYLYISYMPLSEEMENYVLDKFCFINLKTKAIQDFEYENGNPCITSAGNGKLIFFIKGAKQNKYYLSNMDLTDIREIATLGYGENLICDSTYIYNNNGNKVLLSKMKSNTSEETETDESEYCGQTITVYDFDMNEVDSFIIPAKAPVQYVNACDENYFVFFVPESIEKSSKYKIFLFDKSKIGTYHGKPAELIAVESE